jgi:hypothetical protein
VPVSGTVTVAVRPPRCSLGAWTKGWRARRTAGMPGKSAALAKGLHRVDAQEDPSGVGTVDSSVAAPAAKKDMRQLVVLMPCRWM